MKGRIAALSLRMGLCAMLLTGIGLANPRLAERLGFSLAQQGFLVSLEYVSFTAFVLAGGFLCTRFGAPAVLRASLAATAAAFALVALAWDYASAAAGVLLVGAAGSILENALMDLSMEDPATRDRDGLVVQSAFAVGAMLLPASLFAAVTWFSDWRIPYLAAGAASLLLAVPASRGLSARPRPTQRIPLRQALRPYGAFLRRPRNLVVPVALLFYVGAEVGIYAFAPALLEKSGLGIVSGLLATTLVFLFMMAGRLAAARALARVRILPILFAAGALAVAALVLLLGLPGAWAIPALALAGFACGPFYPLLLSHMAETLGESGGAPLAVAMATATLGPVIFGGVAGTLGDAIGPRAMMLPPLACFAAILLLLARFGTARGRRAAS